MQGWSIRRAGAEDADALALVGAATFLENFAGWIEGPSIVAHCRAKHAPDVYAGWAEDGTSALWLAETTVGAPIGYAVLTRPDLPLPDIAPGDLELKRIYSFSPYHGGGPGRALIEAAIAEADRRRAPRLLLGTHRDNARAVAFYTRHGFRTVGERRFQVGAAVFDDIVMARPGASGA